MEGGERGEGGEGGGKKEGGHIEDKHQTQYVNEYMFICEGELCIGSPFESLLYFLATRCLNFIES